MKLRLLEHRSQSFLKVTLRDFGHGLGTCALTAQLAGKPAEPVRDRALAAMVPIFSIVYVHRLH